jgi:hypothetical protein
MTGEDNHKFSMKDFYNPKGAGKIFEIGNNLKKNYPENDY